MEFMPKRSTLSLIVHLVGVAFHSTADENLSQFLGPPFVLGNFNETCLLESVEVDILIGLIGLSKVIDHCCGLTVLLPDGIDNVPSA